MFLDMFHVKHVWLTQNYVHMMGYWYSITYPISPCLYKFHKYERNYVSFNFVYQYREFDSILKVLEL